MGGKFWDAVSKFTEKLTLQQRLILPVILLGVVALISNALSVFSINNVNSNASKIVDNYMAGLETLQNIRYTTASIHKMVLSHIVATDYDTMITVAASLQSLQAERKIWLLKRSLHSSKEIPHPYGS